MKTKIFLQDKAGSGKKIPVHFSGKHQIYLEGSILQVKDEEMEIGLSVFEEDIVDRSYDEASKALILKYKHYEGVRIAVLPMTKFSLPLDLERIIIEEVD